MRKALSIAIIVCLLLPGAGLAQGIGMPPSPPYGPTSLEPGTDRPGGDFASFALPQADAALCRAACDSNGKCAAYTYVNPGVQGPAAMCWLKSVVSQPVPSACCTSGAR